MCACRFLAREQLHSLESIVRVDARAGGCSGMDYRGGVAADHLHA